jgi:hypothetical protein
MLIFYFSGLPITDLFMGKKLILYRELINSFSSNLFNCSANYILSLVGFQGTADFESSEEFIK